MASRMGVLDERVVAMFGERWAHLHAESNSPLRDDDDDPYEFYIPARASMMAVEPEFLERRRPRIPTEPYTVSSMRSTQAPTRSVSHHWVTSRLSWGCSIANDSQSRSPARSSLSAHVRRAVRDRNTPRHSVGADIAAYRAELLSHRRRRPEESQPSAELAQVDGLGDRNRSLSPEGDNIWDTMLTTLTPDPHPPSIGSSFVSTAGSASAAASQSAATRSSATSFAGPDTIEESALEQPCESGCETSDTEEETAQNVLSSLGLRNGQPTYADVVSSTRSSSFDDTLDSIGDVRGMQRIVRTLANRDDIPDEWWAQVGLSRTLSREASANERD